LNKKIIHTFLCCITLILFCGGTCKASEQYWANPNTYYAAVIYDEADLLTDSEELELLETMKPITFHGNVAFVTVEYNYDSAEDYANEAYSDLFDENDGTLFLIDMDNRMIYICSDGKIDQKITEAYANTITDNVYRFASKEEYFKCANQAFEQIYKVLEGGKIAQPMKYICNLLLALIIALSINFAWMARCAKVSRPSNKELMENAPHYFKLGTTSFVFTHETKEAASSGSGGGGRVGGRSGGGGSRGGGRVGGGHRF